MLDSVERRTKAEEHLLELEREQENTRELILMAVQMVEGVGKTLEVDDSFIGNELSP